MIGKLTRTIVRTFAFALTLCATTSAWAVAPEPTAVWEAGEFDQTKGGYVISLNGNRIDEKSGNLVIGEYAANNHLGATIDLSSADATSVSILIKYAELPAATTTHINMSSVADSDGKEFGAYITETGAQRMATFLKNESANNYHYSQTAPTMIMASGSGYFLLTYDTSAGTFAYSGNSIKALSGNGNGSAKGSSAISTISIGGPVTYIDHHTSGNAWPGAVIEKVALFVGKQCSVDEIQQYCGYTADLASELLPWRYNDNCNIYAWREDYNSTKGYHEAKFSSVGADGSFGTAETVSYTKFGGSRPQPGHVLYYDKSGYQPSSDAGFNPFAIGGLFVRARATDNSVYTITGTNAGKRETYLGYSGHTTNWKFDEGFVFNRTANTMIFGTANVEIAAGKIFDCNSAQTSYETQLGSDARLVLSGEGNMQVSTLNATNGGIDFSALKTRTAESAFITGTLAVGANTKLIFPEGTDLSAGYPVASSVTGTLPGTFEIGDLTYEDTLTTTDGKIYSSSLLFATIDSTEATTFATKFPSATSASDCTLCVFESATMSFGSDTVGTLRIHVEAGKTLTLSGNALTATTIYITGKGTVKATTAGVLKGTLKGDGTIIYYGVRPTTTGSDVVFTDAAWEGVLWLQGYNKDKSATGTARQLFPQYWGSTKSTIKWSGVAGYFDHDIACAAKWELEDLVENGTTYYALTKVDGSGSNAPISSPSLSGTGTFYDNSTPQAIFRFADASEYTGNITMGSSAGMDVQFGTTAANRSPGCITILGGGNVTLSDGMTWTPKDSMKVNANGVLNVNTDATVKFTDRGMLGTLNIAEGKTLTAASKDGVSYDTGSSVVNVYGTLNFDTWRWTIGPNTTFNLYEDATISGTGDSGNDNAALDFNVDNGSTIHAIGNATISCTIRNLKANGTAKIDVDAGKTLTFSGNLVGSYGLKKQGGGILKLTGSIAKLPTIEAGTVLLGGSKAWNFDTVRDLTGYALEAGSSIAITQSLAEYRCGVTTVTGLDESIASITVNKYDGTTATLMRTDSTSTLTETPVTSGVACWYDFTFTNTVKSATGSSGSSTSLTTTDVSSFEYVTIQDYAQPTPNSYTAIPAYVRPYSGIALGGKTQFCVALFGTMPSSDNTVLLFLGDGYNGGGGALILASGTSANEAVLYYYTTGKVLTELKRMPASSCRTAPHLYVFQKVGDHQVDIYLDGKLSLSYVNNDITFTLNTGFQVASGYRGTPTGLSGISSSATSEPSAIAMTRIYDRLLTSAEITQLAIEWPYYSPNGDSSRTLDVGETTPDWVETGKWLFNNVGADAAAANSNVEFVNNAGAAASVAVNLNANTAYESLAVSGDNAVSFALKSGFTGKIVPGAATFSADTTVAYDAADFSSTRVEVADGKTLTFDVSSIVTAKENWPNAASVDRIQLTGIATLGTDATVAVTPATAGYWNLSAVEDGGYYYLSVTPGRANGEIYWQSGTYWNSTYNLTGSNPDNPAVFTTDAAGTTPTKYFVGDTVVIPTTTKRYFGPISDGAAIKFDCGGAIEVTKTDSLGYVFKNATVTVASGTTLNFVNSWNGESPEVYGGTISGAGKVKVESGKTLTLSNGATLASETALTGAGKVVLAYVPTAQMTFDDNWTGTVELPVLADNQAHWLNYYGKTGSTIRLNGLSAGWLAVAATTVNANLELAGDWKLTAMSQQTYNFATVSGTGNMSFCPTGYQPTSINIDTVSGYTGTITNNTEATLTIGTLALGSGADVTPGAKLLSTGGTGAFSVTAVTVGGEAQTLNLSYRSDGVYVRSDASYNNVKYETIQEAIDAAEQAGGTYEDVTILDPTATCPDGYYIDTENNNSLAMYQAAYMLTDSTKAYFKTAQLAVDGIESAENATAFKFSRFEVYYGTEEAMSINLSAAAWSSLFKTVKVKCLDGATVAVTTASDEYTLSASAPDEDGIVTYAKTAKAATYVWVATSQSDWYRPTNWKVGSAEGAPASRAPGSTDEVVFSDGASVSGVSGISVAELQVSGTVTLSGSGTLTATTGGIVLTDAAATLTVTGVTLSPAPTTNVGGGATVKRIGDTYKVVYGTIFSVY